MPLLKRRRCWLPSNLSTRRQHKVEFRLLSLAFLIGLSANATGAPAKPLRVAIAPDLIPPFQVLGRRFQAITGVPVQLIPSASGILAQQIEHGAPYDLFAAANVAYVQRLTNEKLTLPGSQHLYAVGSLVLWRPPQVGAPLHSLSELLSPQIHRIAIANPKIAPYGAAAQQALMKSGLWNRLRARIVYAENVEQAYQYVKTGNADAALLPLSLVISEVGKKGDTQFYRVPPSLYSPINQAVAVIAITRQPAMALRFLHFLLGKPGRLVLKRYGFKLPPPPK